jgi:hypothetical protein
MNWLDAVGLGLQIRGMWKERLLATLAVGVSRTFTLRTRIAGRMWRFDIAAAREE